MDTLLTVFCVLFGFIIGSFLNVVIYRLNTNKSLGGRSMCLSCSNTLQWYDLVPVFSYFCLFGRCRCCKSKISFQYPLVELGTGVLFGLLFFKLKFLLSLDTSMFVVNYVYYAFLVALLVVITVYDIRHKIIPDTLSFAFGFLAFLGIFFIDSGLVFFHWPILMDLVSGLALSAPFAFLWVVSRGRWMGLGDAKLAVGLGFMLGLTKLISATLIAFWTGAIYGIILIVLRKASPKSEIPFAPFLILGTLVAFFFDLSMLNFVS